VLRTEPEIVTNYVANGTVALSFHHLLDLGSGSRSASIAAECAGAQDPLGFWRMRQLLFERQGEIRNATPESYAGWASEIGLDGDALGSCLADPAVGEKVDRMDAERTEVGIRQRPTFDINGQLYAGALPWTQLQPLLDEAIAAQP
jgi:protein-disulfide isomerase